MRVVSSFDHSDRPDHHAEQSLDGGCVAPVRHGWTCTRPPIPDSPFPICIKHAAELFAFLHDGIAKETALAKAIRALESYDQGRPSMEVSIPGKGRSVVYYVRVGNHIKIGYSTNLSQRMRGYPPDAEVLAIEPGGRELELARHEQFAHQLRRGLEWFAPSLDLLAHIESLRGVAGSGEGLLA